MQGDTRDRWWTGYCPQALKDSVLQNCCWNGSVLESAPSQPSFGTETLHETNTHLWKPTENDFCQIGHQSYFALFTHGVFMPCGSLGICFFWLRRSFWSQDSRWRCCFRLCGFCNRIIGCINRKYNVQTVRLIHIARRDDIVCGLRCALVFGSTRRRAFHCRMGPFYFVLWDLL